jgi:hypothetical protein
VQQENMEASCFKTEGAICFNFLGPRSWKREGAGKQTTVSSLGTYLTLHRHLGQLLP